VLPEFRVFFDLTGAANTLSAISYSNVKPGRADRLTAPDGAQTATAVEAQSGVTGCTNVKPRQGA